MGKMDRSSDNLHLGRETVLSAVDAIDGRDHLVIADVSRDDAWIAVPEGQADPIPASR
jgi:hypothetical protein